MKLTWLIVIDRSVWTDDILTILTLVLSNNIAGNWKVQMSILILQSKNKEIGVVGDMFTLE